MPKKKALPEAAPVTDTHAPAPTEEAEVVVTELPTQLFVTRTFKSDVVSADETIAVHRFATPPGKVDYRAGLTINLGNYESIRVEIGVTVPTYREELDGAFDYAKQFVQDRLTAEVEDIKNGKKKKKSEDPF